MPNFCDNSLELTGDRKKLIKLVKNIIKKNQFFNLIRKVPANIEDMCRWCEDNWGTKWDVEADDIFCSDSLEGILEELEQSTNKIECIDIGFYTAWAPPIGIYEQLEELGYVVKAHYFEPGCGFCGTFDLWM